MIPLKQGGYHFSMEKICPQCKKVVSGAESRLIQDTCGHVKCRKCLLSDSTQCPSCSGNFPDHSDLILPEHIESIPGDPVHYKCLNCERGFEEKSFSKYHIKCTAANEPHLLCEYCDRKFDSHSHLKYHKLSHQNLNPFMCQNCNKGFKNKGKLNRHMQIHSERKKNWVCRECSRAFMSSDSFRRHLKIHIGFKEFQCNACDKKFTERYDLQKHQITHSDNKNFTCDICNRLFKRKYDLTLHMKGHQPVPLRNFHCSLCDKVFYSLHNMKRHKRLHQNHKTFKCNDCKKYFTRKGNLERHVKSIHLEEEFELSGTNGLVAIEENKNESSLKSEQRLLAIEHTPIERSFQTDNITSVNNRVSVIQRVPIIVQRKLT